MLISSLDQLLRPGMLFNFQVAELLLVARTFGFLAVLCLALSGRVGMVVGVPCVRLGQEESGLCLYVAGGGGSSAQVSLSSGTCTC